jgi:asparagine synthetase B (glutamine-hydrolysing)
MCGIFCSLSRTSHVSPDAHVLELLQRRGPDSTSCVQHTFGDNVEEISPRQESSGNTFLYFTSTVLSLRGSRTVSQPLQDQDGSHVLCWNGEAWSIAGRPAQGNDTEAVFELLSAAVSQSHEAEADVLDGAATIAQRMASVAGPYAFVFYDKHAGKVYLGRDFLGRRALLWRTNESGDLLISSVTSGSHDNAWTEVEADGVYCIDLNIPSGLQNGLNQDPAFLSNFTISKVPYHVAADGNDSIQQKTFFVGDLWILRAAQAHGKVGDSIFVSQRTASGKSYPTHAGIFLGQATGAAPPRLPRTACAEHPRSSAYRTPFAG